MDLIEVLNADGIRKAIHYLKTVEGWDKEKRLLAVFAARQVQHLMPLLSRQALDVCERFANGLATEDELRNARAFAAEALFFSRPTTHCYRPHYPVNCAWYTTFFSIKDAANSADLALDSELDPSAEKQEFWQAVEAKFRELFGEK